MDPIPSSCSVHGVALTDAQGNPEPGRSTADNCGNPKLRFRLACCAAEELDPFQLTALEVLSAAFSEPRRFEPGGFRVVLWYTAGCIYSRKPWKLIGVREEGEGG